MTTLTLGGPIAAHVEQITDRLRRLLRTHTIHAACAVVDAELHPTTAEWAYVRAILRQEGIDVH